MQEHLFEEFLRSRDTVRIYEVDRLIFSSDKERLLPLLEYIARFGHHYRRVVVFDKVVGNAAALLSIKANCEEVCSPVGSRIALETLGEYGIECHIIEVVPYIRDASGKDMCPMEKLSLGKEPGEFYGLMRDIVDKPQE